MDLRSVQIASVQVLDRVRTVCHCWRMRALPLRPRRVLALLTAALMCVGGLAVPAAGTNYGPGDGIFLPDSGDHWYCFYDGPAFWSVIPSGERWRADAAMQYLSDWTLMDAYSAGSCASSTDVVFEYNDLDYLGNGVGGLYTCDASLWGVCDHAWVSIDPWEHVEVLGSVFHPLLDWSLRKTFVHEVGHSAGLRHETFFTPEPGIHAMLHGLPTSTAWDWLGYTAHHRCHINAWIWLGDWANAGGCHS
jgi:hypothetical protein